MRVRARHRHPDLSRHYHLPSSRITDFPYQIKIWRNVASGMTSETFNATNFRTGTLRVAHPKPLIAVA